MYKIGVFDSGIGGRSIVNAIKKELPDNEVIFKNDVEHVPYGTKSPNILLSYVLPILNDLIKKDCKVIVIACNTVSTTLIGQLRELVVVPLISMEPMVKPAAEQTKSGVIAVCATPTTLASKRYAWLKEQYAKNITVLEPDCSDWSYMIETNTVDHVKIGERISEVCENKADIIVLACTHYHWIENDIKQIAKKYEAVVIQPEQAIIRQLRRVLEQLA